MPSSSISQKTSLQFEWGALCVDNSEDLLIEYIQNQNRWNFMKAVNKMFTCFSASARALLRWGHLKKSRL